MMRNAYSARLQSRRGFTLVEVIVSAIIVAFMGAVGFFSYSNVRSLNIDSRERDTAKIFAQRTMERVRADAQTGFDTLIENENAVLAADPVVANQFPDHLRFVTITNQGTPELKRVQVNITWNHEQNPAAPRNYQLVAIFTRPGNLLPGNIQGNVFDLATPAIPVAGALVTINNLVTGENHAIATNAAGFYTFANIYSGAFTLTPGDWNLSATAVGYNSYAHPTNPVVVLANTNVIVNFGMVAQATGTIQGHVEDLGTAGALSQYVSLFQGGNFVNMNDATWAAGTFTFIISFAGPGAQGFTLVTSRERPGVTADQKERSLPYLASRHCGNFPDCNGWGKAYNYRGWSSAVVGADRDTFIGCNPWTNFDANIQLLPGQTINIVIKLVPVPTATLTGSVFNASRALVPNSTVSAFWHYAGIAILPSFVSGNGNYAFNVPAEQSLFPNLPAYYLRAQAQATANRICCCNVACSQTLTAGPFQIGPLNAGDVVTRDFTLPAPTDNICGDAKGNVDEVNDGPLAGATVTIAGLTATTNGAGAYEFKCGGAGYRIPQGAYAVNASKSGFYAFSSSGNSFYAPRGSIQIIANDTKVYVPSIRLLRQGVGTVTGRVVQLIAGVPTAVAGITVKLDWFSDGSDNQSTDAKNGTFTFNNAPESWPPPSVVDDPSFVQVSRKHTVKVPDTAAYIGASKANIDLRADDILDVGDIVVSARSGT